MDIMEQRAVRKMAAAMARYIAAKEMPIRMRIACQQAYLAFRVLHRLSPRNARLAVHVGFIRTWPLRLRWRVYLSWLLLFNPARFNELRKARNL